MHRLDSSRPRRRPTLNRLVSATGWVLFWSTGAASAADDEPWNRLPPPATPLFTHTLTLGPTDDWKFTPSGHGKTMVEAYRNPNFGLDGYSEDSWILQRIQTGLNVAYRESLDWFTELTWGGIAGKKQPLAPPDRDDPDVLQLFLQGELPIDASQSLVTRVGRQVLYYGSGRLISHREGANQRLAQDAARLSWRDSDSGWDIDGIVASPVQIHPEAFDNQSIPDEWIWWGIYAVGPALGDARGTAGTDAYYLGMRQHDSLLAGPGNTEVRHTVGTRWWDVSWPWIYNSEIMFQFGDCAGRTIIAGAASLGGGYVWELESWVLTATVKGDVISGGDPTGRMNTFNPLFQANNYFNEGGYVSPSNLYNLNPLLTVDPIPDISITGGVNWLWRFSGEDDVYGPPFSRVAPPAPEGQRFLGTALSLSMGWSPHPALDFSVGYTHHIVGSSLSAVGGRNVDYFQTTFRIQF